jgi:hypothetical protein
MSWRNRSRFALASRSCAFVESFARLEMFLLAQLQMQAYLLFQFRVELVPMHQHPQSSCDFAQPVHARTPFSPLQSHA